MNQFIGAIRAKSAHFQPTKQDSPNIFSARDLKAKQFDDFSQLVEMISSKLAIIKKGPKHLAGDFDRDGDVDLDDLNIYRNSEGSTGKNLMADANKDGIINNLDRQILLNNFGKKL